jgi:hypothetical protein
MMRQIELQPGEPIGPLDFLSHLPHETASSSDLGWVRLQAARCVAVPVKWTSEFFPQVFEGFD